MTNILWFVIIALLFSIVCAFALEWCLKAFLGVVTMLIVLVTFWNYLVLRNISYIINNEQIILKRGVFNRTTNYMELYRVYDYQKKQSIMETTLGLMNIIVLSRDMSNQKVIFMGISNDDNVIPFIRERVEIEKQRKHIVEFNNPYSGSLV
jgi:uncharacterized membrane protein YdbT with pleckstrin-like domain